MGHRIGERCGLTGSLSPVEGERDLSGRSLECTEVSAEELLTDPIVWLVMQADRVGR
jgi:hypothetical protein